MKNRVEDLEAKIEENGEIIQFTEQQDFVTSVHAELAQDAEYLKSREDEINRLTQELDHSSQRELKLKGIISSSTHICKSRKLFPMSGNSFQKFFCVITHFSEFLILFQILDSGKSSESCSESNIQF